jgi:hypothetical protein
LVQQLSLMFRTSDVFASIAKTSRTLNRPADRVNACGQTRMRPLGPLRSSNIINSNGTSNGRLLPPVPPPQMPWPTSPTRRQWRRPRRPHRRWNMNRRIWHMHALTPPLMRGSRRRSQRSPSCRPTCSITARSPALPTPTSTPPPVYQAANLVCFKPFRVSFLQGEPNLRCRGPSLTKLSLLFSVKGLLSSVARSP